MYECRIVINYDPRYMLQGYSITTSIRQNELEIGRGRQHSLCIVIHTLFLCHTFVSPHCFQGRALFASRDFAEEESLFEESPVVCAQFLWNELYKYSACSHCLKSLETAEAMCRRLTNNPSLVLPHPECCPVDESTYVTCPHCQVLWPRSDKTLESFGIWIFFYSSMYRPIECS